MAGVRVRFSSLEEEVNSEDLFANILKRKLAEDKFSNHCFHPNSFIVFSTFNFYFSKNKAYETNNLSLPFPVFFFAN